MKKRVFAFSAVISMMISVNAFADFSINGALVAVRPNTAYNINPYNISTITGVGEGNNFAIYTDNGVINIPLDYPLYKLSDAYCDKITCIDGVWGVERNVGIRIFDGSEDWSLYRKASFQNDNTTIFRCPFGQETPRILNGVSTHFDVHTFDSQKTNIYDGISFGENSEEILMRIMNVRNVKDVDTLKTYLKTQFDNGTPVKFMYFLNEPVFTPFDEQIQEQLSSVNPEKVRYVDKNCTGIEIENENNISTDLFVSSNSESEEMNNFMAAVEDIKIFNSEAGKRFFINGIFPEQNSIRFAVNDDSGNVYTSEVEYSKVDFTQSKAVELEFTSEDMPEVIKIYVNFNLYHVPLEAVQNFSYEKTGIKTERIAEKELVLPEKMYVLNGSIVDFNNALLNGTENDGNYIEVTDENGNIISENGKITADFYGDRKYNVSFNGKTEQLTVYSSDAEENIFDNKTFMFLGDSLINENLYTKYFVNTAENSKMTLIGTRGEEGFMHEGRGGWAAYDYCNVQNKYGYDNPFLNDGKFDFKYYMDNNGFQSLDYVVINLGINDLNLKEHNGHDEILSYFDTIIKSINSYNDDIKIIINTPIMLFDTGTTKTAKNDRLQFIKDLYPHFESGRYKNVYVSPVYLAIDSFGDFKFKTGVIDEYNQDSSMKVTDTTHPNNGGYEALAKATYAFIQSIR